MRLKGLGIGLLVLAGVVLSTAAARQDAKTKPASAGADDMEAMMAAIGSPNEHHEVLGAKIGTWDAKVQFFTPGMEGMVSQATSKFEWIMDGRFVQDTTTSEFMGMPFQGHGLTGYDNLKQKYVASWIDNMSTAIMTTEGTYDAKTKTFTYHGEMPDMMAGKYVPTRATETVTDADHWTMKSYSPGPDGKEMLTMQIDYTRKK